MNSIDTSDQTNNFYDNTETYNLKIQEVAVDGEIINPGPVDFSTLPERSVIVKETVLDTAGKDSFTGAFRYDGFSLFDILDKKILKKANAEEFKPIIDLFVEVENKNGEKVVFSWGEIFYPNNLHRIIIANKVARIVPSKTKELWTLPVTGKIVSGNDLITERNISDPVRITVRSFPKSFVVNKGLSPMYSPEIKLLDKKNPIGKVSSIPDSADEITFNTVFYGRGTGIHSTTPFKGYLLKEILLDEFAFSRDNLRKGIMCFSALDGYRCAVTYSELFNRNDQQEFLLIQSDPGKDGGLFRLFVAADFFSDRAVKSLTEIQLNY